MNARGEEGRGRRAWMLPAPARALFRSTTARIAAVIFLTEVAMAAGLLLFVEQTSHRAFVADQQEQVARLRDDLVRADRAGGRAALVGLIGDRLALAEARIAVILLKDRDGRIVAGNLDAWPTVIPDHLRWREIELYRRGARQPEVMGVSATVLPDGERLLTGYVISFGHRLRQINKEAMLAAMALSVPIALVVAMLLGHMIAMRISAIAHTARAVGAGRMDDRVPVTGGRDAFDALGEAINAMLDRIGQLIAELRMVTDGLAHDLRSPITRLTSVLERARLETDDDRARAALESVSAEADQLLAMLSTALLISRTEAGIGRDRFQPADIHAFLDDLAEVYGPLAEDKGFAIQVDAPVGLVVAMDRELLGQAIGNLIENAIRYAQGGTLIRLAAHRTNGGVALSVADNGPGIAPELREQALRRFGRLDPARSTEGTGLGLSLVTAVAVMHGGTFRLEDNAPGLRAIMTLEEDSDL